LLPNNSSIISSAALAVEALVNLFHSIPWTLPGPKEEVEFIKYGVSTKSSGSILSKSLTQ